jgi:hypothetical protein
VYMAEHYVVDILLGWIYAGVAFRAVNVLADRITERRGQAAARAT